MKTLGRIALTLISIVALVLSTTHPVGATSHANMVNTKSKENYVCPFVIGHRAGGGIGKQENSKSAWNKALKAGISILEVDVQFTKDNVPVLIHDYDLSRVSNGNGLVRQKTFKEVQRLRLRNGDKIPKFASVLQAAANADAVVMFDTRVAPSAKQGKILNALIKRYDMVNSVILQTWLSDAISWGSKSGIQTIRIYQKPGLDSWSGQYADAHMKQYSSITAENVKKAKALPVFAYTNGLQSDKENAEWLRLTRIGVAGIVTDRPIALMKWTKTNCKHRSESIIRRAMPDLIDLNAQQALQRIAKAGFKESPVIDYLGTDPNFVLASVQSFGSKSVVHQIPSPSKVKKSVSTELKITLDDPPVFMDLAIGTSTYSQILEEAQSKFMRSVSYVSNSATLISPESVLVSVNNDRGEAIDLAKKQHPSDEIYFHFE